MGEIYEGRIMPRWEGDLKPNVLDFRRNIIVSASDEETSENPDTT